MAGSRDPVAAPDGPAGAPALLVSLAGYGAGLGRVALSRSVLDHAPVGMAVQTGSGQMVWANASLAQVLGMDLEQLAGRSVSDFVHPEDREAHQEALAEVVDAVATVRQRTERWRTAEGALRHVALSASLALAEDGRVLELEDGQRCLILQVTDETDRRLAEDRLAQVSREIEARNAELERSNAELERFAYVASHDLSEPLRVIAGHVDLLARRYRGALDERADTWIGFAVDGCQRQRLLIDDLLRYSRAGRGELTVTDVALGDLLAEVLADLAPMVAESGAEVRTGGPLPEVRADRSQLAQVLTNLVTNALKFRREGEPPRVEVTASRSGDVAEVVVSDAGPGVPHRYREEVFEVFRRLHPREVPGTGIGLAICRRIAERHGGSIEVSESDLGGARFVVTLTGQALSKEVES